jgi:16S rRNA (adenine1518-N6/adenine1519-N6)-dimethyltransferase
MSADQAVRLLGAGDVRAIASRLGVHPTKRLGQNFVVEPGTVRQIASLAGPFAAADVILEVGPGLGSLTLALLEAAVAEEPAGDNSVIDSADPVMAETSVRAGMSGGPRIVAVEIDPAMAGELPKTIADRAPSFSGRVTVIRADALGVAELAGGPPTVLAANLPYNVAVPVVLHLLAVFPAIRRGVVMVQAEVADRMCAGPGSRVYGVPSAKLAWYAQARLAGTVPRNVFWPVPNVDSKLVAFTRHQVPVKIPGAEAPDGAPEDVERTRAGAAEVAEVTVAAAGSDEEAGGVVTRSAVTRGTAAGNKVTRGEVFAVIDAAFGQRRKTLRAALSGWAGSPAQAERILHAASVSPGARGESLGIAEFARIAQARASLAEGTIH